MISFLKKLFTGSAKAPSPEPRERSAAVGGIAPTPPPRPTVQPVVQPSFLPAPKVATEYPKTYLAQQDAEGREDIFEPSLIHFRRAFSRSDPKAGAEWHIARRHAIDHILRLIASSPWKEHLVLRGSLLLKEWMGEKAREPKDIDWVFIPSEVGIEDPTAQRLIEEITGYLKGAPVSFGPVLDVENIVWEDIWAYHRAAGKRVLVPWRVEGLPPGEVQMDIVFSEPLPEDPVKTQLKLSDGSHLEFHSASPEVSLAWKILWLLTDFHPQGKDLYDATLLAESVTLRPELLYHVLSNGDYYLNNIGPDMFGESVDWANFKVDYPWVSGDEAHWRSRFDKSIAGCMQMLFELHRRFNRG